MTDSEINEIASRWAGVGKGFKRLTFDEAQADMMALLGEVRALRPENEKLKGRIMSAELKAGNMGTEMLREIEQVVRKYA